MPTANTAVRRRQQTNQRMDRSGRSFCTMASLASHRQWLEADHPPAGPDLGFVARPARESAVRPLELEAGAVVVEGDAAPAQDRMALRALERWAGPRELSVMGIAVAGRTGRGSPLEADPRLGIVAVGVTAPAGDALVSPFQGKPGAVMVEDHAREALQRMTGLAAALGDEAIDLSLMGIAMAGGASGGGEAELDDPRRTVGRSLLQDALRELSHRHLPVAGNAGDGEVGALQRVSR